MKNEVILRYCIWGFEDITLDEITQLIGYQQSRTFIKGQRKSSIDSALAKENGWIMDSLAGKYASFEDQMSSLLDVIEANIDVFKLLSNRYYCEFSCALYIYFNNEESTPWIHLSTRYNQLIKELNIEFDVDIYCLSNDADL